MEQSLYRQWMKRLQMFLAAPAKPIRRTAQGAFEGTSTVSTASASVSG